MTNPADRLIPLLEQIRDNQRQQITNFERAMTAQEEAAVVHRFGKRLLLVLIAAPWLLVGLLLIIIVMEHAW